MRILGVVMDSELRYRNHVKKVSTKGLKAALALKQMRMLSPIIARQLFIATVAPVIDYASSIWMHTLGPSTTRVISQIQKLGGQAITGAFSSVAGAIVEAEAYISPVKARQREKALRTLIDLHTLLSQHLISRLSLRSCKKFISPLQRIRKEFSGFHPRRLERIKPYVITPWEPRIVYEKYT